MDLHTLSFIGFSFDVIGKILVSYTVIRVHYRFWQEHKVDERVFQEMKSEQFIGLAGIILILIGYIFQVPLKI